jgi:hypothetical protein
MPNHDLICSKCGSAVKDRGYEYACRCFTLRKIVKKKELAYDVVRDLFTLGRTGVIRGFTNKKGRPFDASLSIEDGKLTFHFDSESEIWASRTTTISVTGVSSGLVVLDINGRCAFRRTLPFGLVSPQLAACYATITGAKYLVHAIGDVSREKLEFKASIRLFVKYLLCHQSPRSAEMRRALSYLRGALGAFSNWSAELLPLKRRQTLSGASHATSFPSGVFPWLNVDVARQNGKVVVELPDDPAVQAQFRASIRLAESLGDSAFSVPAAAERAVFEWLRVVRKGRNEPDDENRFQ